MEQVVGHKKDVDQTTSKVERMNFMISNQRTHISDLETELAATKEGLCSFLLINTSHSFVVAQS